MDKLYIINGWTDAVGQWELELFDDLDDAKEQFEFYIEDYDIPESGVNWEDLSACGVSGRFWIEEHDLKNL